MSLEHLFEESVDRRDVGIQRAMDHAEGVIRNWKDRASDLLKEYVARMRESTFLAEDFVSWADGKIEAPPDMRAWGGPIRMAAVNGLIVKVGYAPANSSNRSPKTLWKSF